MTRPGIERRSPGPLANTLTIKTNQSKSRDFITKKSQRLNVLVLLNLHQNCKMVKQVLIVFIGNPFEMRLLNLRINFYLLRTFCPHLGSFFVCFLFNLTTFQSGPVAPWIEALSLYSSRWALSEDSGFKSYPSWSEVYLVKNEVR